MGGVSNNEKNEKRESGRKDGDEKGKREKGR